MASLETDSSSGLAIMPFSHPPSAMAEMVARLLIADKNGRSRLDHVVAGGGNALHFAIKSRDMQSARFALDNGADPNVKDADGKRPLHLAAVNGMPAMTKLLLAHRADPNLFSGLQFHVEALGGGSHLTPLHVAALKGNTQVVKELLDKGANVNAAEPFCFWTPLLFAIHAGHDEIVHLLLASGADVDGNCNAFESPLILAVVKKRIDLVQTLYCCGADLNRRDGDGDPPIHNAAANGASDLVNFILAMSDDEKLDLKGTSGRPAWWFAQNYGHLEIMGLLKEKQREQLKNNESLKEFPRDISDDSGNSIATIGTSKLLKDITRAGEHIYALSNSNSWKDRIRFVVQAPPGQPHALEVIEPYINGKDDQEPFVAVSYCWASQDRYLGEPVLIKVPSDSGTDLPPRETRARPDVILKCLEFAHSKGIRRIWIDQECIHQDDPEDKKILVGTMHRLYRQATLTVAVLGNHIKTADDVKSVRLLGNHLETADDVKSVKQLGNDNPSSEALKTDSSRNLDIHEHSRILTGRIFEDRWFTRAWTTQEAFSAQWDIDNLVYMIGWDRDFDRTGLLWQEMTMSLPEGFLRQTVKRTLLLDNRDTWRMSSVPHGKGFSFLDASTQTVVARREAFTLNERDLEKYGRDYIRRAPGVLSYTLSHLFESVIEFLSSAFSKPTAGRRCDGDYSSHKSSLTETFASESHAMAMTAVFFALREKRNLMVSDRPGIFANLARYQRYIDMRGLVQAGPDISYTACILALALANGDLSFLLDDNHWPESDSKSSSSKPSWLPMRLKLRNPRFPPRHTWAGKVTGAGNPCVVVGDYLVARGVLWEVWQCSDLEDLQGDIKTCLEYCEQNPSDVKQQGVAILQATLRKLFCKKKEHLVILIITLARQRNWASPAELDCALQQLGAWFRGGSNWPDLVKPDWSSTADGSHRKNVSIRSSHMDKERWASDIVDHDDIIPKTWGDPLLRWIYWRVLHGEPFPLGRFKTDNNRQEYAIFGMNMNDHARIFVPMAQLNYEFNGDTFLSRDQPALLWRVNIADPSKIPGEHMAEATERLGTLGSKYPKISEEALTVERDKGILGIWSPFLSVSGVLSLDKGSGLYNMTPLGNAATYHMIT